MRKRNNPLRGLPLVHPGALLREDVLPHVSMTKSDIARSLGISRAQLYALLAEKAPVTAAMALRLGRFFGNGPELWLNMQSNYDLEFLARTMERELAHIPQMKAA
ncbi:MAG TPA: HigA family addiction module antitoxin [Rhizomicrobium sp.]|jgi:addiction module HigA family antidote|nr:HigA family addiction module antitoxin [Rhizomicrobium sp.]